MHEQQIKTQTAQETIKLAEELATNLRPGDVLTLEGDLGAGKTTFAKGIAKGLGVERTVSSPTFTIVKEYEGEIPFYHMDVYRLENSDEDIGFSEYFNGDGIAVVEWAQFIEDYLPEDRLNINITYVDEHTRNLTFSATSKHFEWVVNELKG
ncbi:tRNA threonylcarbamoyladenosine biosynthesis protein TsaE [Virgibacillus halotolerans]|uniref:tRNA (adenosine(37)-N6)-threonylcarbamoyltransferase complex ATPase subunit type 1 TsaE n=1 Tax=Virgibacillus halotolerans TaxID=1071053 RepID=UPI001960863F|nr:tRNA (adenosine(37)-N6)-threonylcarbamoyltransferase complex ATPase subunit type 1 TsaE [Virgibacillus halotolerans]MBM7601569.1 tRNA threonylcarbamoyladenosine biosynthesis protein TsaE [Virgibacillus halotolerans]